MGCVLPYPDCIQTCCTAPISLTSKTDDNIEDHSRTVLVKVALKDNLQTSFCRASCKEYRRLLPSGTEKQKTSKILFKFFDQIAPFALKVQIEVGSIWGQGCLLYLLGVCWVLAAKLGLGGRNRVWIPKVILKIDNNQALMHCTLCNAFCTKQMASSIGKW